MAGYISLGKKPFGIGGTHRPSIRPPQILDFQIDDIVRPRDFLGTEGRVRRTKAAMKAGRV